MRVKSVVLALSASVMVSAGALAAAQQPGMKPMPGMPEQQENQGMMGGGMMGGGPTGGGMMGMMNMMRNCERMMGRAGGHAMPQLPPGNEKLQLQMHAEMMQRMGEILSKYAAQLK